MKRLVILLVILTVGCTAEDEFAPYEPIYLSVNVYKIEGFTPEEAIVLIETVYDLEMIINSEKFYKEFIRTKLVRTNGLSNREVYEKIFNGAEIAFPEEDQEMDLWFLAFRDGGGISGTVNIPENRIRINTGYLMKEYSRTIGTIMHEYSHLHGFGHTGSGDVMSVPYAIGGLVNDLNADF